MPPCAAAPSAAGGAAAPSQARRALGDVLASRELALSVGRCAGFQAAAALSACARRCSEGASPALPALREALPTRLVVVGGSGCGEWALGAVEAFDPEAEEWLTWTTLPTPRCSCAVVALDGGLWVLGGGDRGNEPLPTAERLSLATLAWTSHPPLREARRGCAAGVLAGRVVAVGGSGRHGGPGGADGVLGSAERLDPAQGAWEPLRPPRQARSRCGLATARGGLCVMGGCGPGGAALASVERLDAQSAEWGQLPPLSTARLTCSGGAIGNRLYALGSEELDGASVAPAAALEVLDLDAVGAGWACLPPIPAPRGAFAGAAAAGRLYAVGGWSWLDYSGAVQRFCPREGAWAALPRMPTRRAWCAAACVRLPCEHGERPLLCAPAPEAPPAGPA